jgi:predicted DNA binding protein
LVYYEVGFKLRHDCPFNRLSENYPSVILAWWSNFDQNVLEVSGTTLESLATYESELNTSIAEMGGRIVRRTSEGSKIQLVVTWDGSKWEYGTTRVFMKYNCLVLQPNIHTGGREWYRVISFTEKDVKGLFKELDSTGDVEILSTRTVEEGTVRDTFMITAPELLGELTKNQVDALVLALDSGYYAVPKKATTEDVAARVGLPRTTFEDRLRRAESKVLRSVAPYMRLSPSGRKGGRAAPGRMRVRSDVRRRDFDEVEEAPSFAPNGRS